MVDITIELTDELMNEMKKYPIINWQALIIKVFEKKLDELEKLKLRNP